MAGATHEHRNGVAANISPAHLPRIDQVAALPSHQCLPPVRGFDVPVLNSPAFPPTRLPQWISLGACCYWCGSLGLLPTPAAHDPMHGLHRTGRSQEWYHDGARICEPDRGGVAVQRRSYDGGFPGEAIQARLFSDPSFPVASPNRDEQVDCPSPRVRIGPPPMYRGWPAHSTCTRITVPASGRCSRPSNAARRRRGGHPSLSCGFADPSRSPP